MKMSQGIRRGLLVAGSGLAILILAALSLWLVPTWLTQDPPLPAPADRQKAITDTRSGLVAFLAALGAIEACITQPGRFVLTVQPRKRRAAGPRRRRATARKPSG